MPESWLAIPHLRQEEPHTCTPACVRMVVAFFGDNVPEPEIVRLLGTTERGTLFRSIESVSSLGFDVAIGTGTRAELSRITGAGVPVIVASE